MKNIVLAPNPTGTGHNMRMYTIGKELLARHKDHHVTVLLGSMQDIFRPLFKSAGMDIIDLSPTGIIDFSTSSHLERNFNWNTMIKNYFVPTFFNGDKILRYLKIFMSMPLDLVISDYNINASIAAVIAGKKNVFVTERHNFTLVDVTNEDLKSGGFNVNEKEITSAKQILDDMFKWLLNHTDVMITDKPFIKAMDEGKTAQKYFESGKARFVGPIYAKRDNNTFDYGKYGIDPDLPYIICTVSGTTMLKEDRDKTIAVYIRTYREALKSIPGLQLILIGNISICPEKGIFVIPYVPDWAPLLEKCTLLISHPGWITVTEAAKLRVAAIFYLPNFMEYHEVEAYRRLECLGLPVFSGDDINAFSKKILGVIKSGQSAFKKGYEKLSPKGDGLKKAVDLIEKSLSAA